MTSDRETYNYSLYQGHKKVYIGTTKDPGRRKSEHGAAGKQFTRMEIKGRAKTIGGAHRAEVLALAAFRSGHRGKNPRYNKRDNG